MLCQETQQYTPSPCTHHAVSACQDSIQPSRSLSAYILPNPMGPLPTCSLPHSGPSATGYLSDAGKLPGRTHASKSPPGPVRAVPVECQLRVVDGWRQDRICQGEILLSTLPITRTRVHTYAVWPTFPFCGYAGLLSSSVPSGSGPLPTVSCASLGCSRCLPGKPW